jgi:pyridoxamine 5'-phosphate oxidase
VRIMLFRGVSGGGFVFYTNYNSRKAAELLDNPRAAMVFHWPLVERQVRIEGRIKKLTRAESDAYFASRPRESRLGAWISPQSAEIPDRAFLETEFEAARRQYAGKAVPRPPFWGGFRLIPDCIEFWQQQPHRLHDRFSYQRRGGRWRVARLGP